MSVYSDEVEFALQPVAVQFNTDLSFFQLPQKVCAILWLVTTGIPDQLLARALMAFRNAALELRVFDFGPVVVHFRRAVLRRTAFDNVGIDLLTAKGMPKPLALAMRPIA